MDGVRGKSVTEKFGWDQIGIRSEGNWQRSHNVLVTIIKKKE